MRDRKEFVDLEIVDHPEQAKTLFFAGLRRLFLLVLPTKKILKQLPIDHKLCLQYMRVGSCDDLKQDLLAAVVETVMMHEPLPRRKAIGSYCQQRWNMRSVW